MELSDAVDELYNEIFIPLSIIDINQDKINNLVSMIPTRVYVRDTFDDDIYNEYMSLLDDIEASESPIKEFVYDHDESDGYHPTKSQMLKLLTNLGVISMFNDDDYAEFLRKKTKRKSLMIHSNHIDAKDVTTTCRHGKLRMTVGMKKVPRSEKAQLLTDKRIKQALAVCVVKVRTFTLRKLGMTSSQIPLGIQEECLDLAMDRVRKIVERHVQKVANLGERYEPNRSKLKKQLQTAINTCIVSKYCEGVDCEQLEEEEHTRKENIRKEIKDKKKESVERREHKTKEALARREKKRKDREKKKTAREKNKKEIKERREQKKQEADERREQKKTTREKNKKEIEERREKKKQEADERREQKKTTREKNKKEADERREQKKTTREKNKKEIEERREQKNTTREKKKKEVEERREKKKQEADERQERKKNEALEMIERNKQSVAEKKKYAETIREEKKKETEKWREETEKQKRKAEKKKRKLKRAAKRLKRKKEKDKTKEAKDKSI